MSKTHGFSWIDKPLLAGMAEPVEPEEFQWLRDQGIQLIISLTEESPPREWINDAGLMNVHEPIPDMTAPTQEQVEKIISNIRGATDQQMGVAVHCSAGMGRTGTILACYFVEQGLNARNALSKIRRLRPGSVETEEQVEVVNEYARRKGR